MSIANATLSQVSTAHSTSTTLFSSFLSSAFNGMSIAGIIILALFLYLSYKFLKVLYTTMIFAVLGALFPIFADKFLGASIPLNLHTIISFAIMGVVIYLIYILLKMTKFFLKIVKFIIKIILLPFKIMWKILKAIFGGGKKENKNKGS